MKKIIFTLLFLTYFCTGTLVFAQYNQSSPNTFQTFLSNGGYCPNSNYKGSIHYDTQSNKLVFCTGVNSIQSGSSVWANATGGISYLSGNIGIGVTSPTFGLEMGSGTFARFSNSLFITGKLGINTNAPSEKLELVDTHIRIFNIFDNVKWSQSHNINNVFEFANSLVGGPRLYIKSGNIGINQINPTSKLSVVGNVSFAGNVTSAGKGLLRNSTSTQLDFTHITVSLGASYSILGNACLTIDVDLPPGFAAAPAVALSSKWNDNASDDRIIITIEGVTTTTATLRLCNTSATVRPISRNEGYTLIIVGEGN